MAANAEINALLNAALEEIQADVDEKVTKAIRLFIQCDQVYKGIVLRNTGFTGTLTAQTLRDHFDFLDLIDLLDNAIDNMEYEVYENRPEGGSHG